MEFTIVIPYRPSGDIWRERAYEFVRAYYATRHSACPIIVADADTEEWSKGAAVNAGVIQSDTTGIILADADSIVSQRALFDAIEAVRNGRRWVVPHGEVFRLTEAWTEKVYAGSEPRKTEVVRYPYLGPAGGGINVMTREAFDTVNGMDPRFLGWGGEDICFAKALTTLGIYHHRLDNALWHFYHPHPAPDLRGSEASEALVARYKQADRKPDAMRALVFNR